MKRELKEKMENIVSLVDNVMVDPEIDIEYCIPEVAVTAETCDLSKDPYIQVTYVVSEYTRPTRKIHLTDKYLNNDAKLISNLVTFSIEQFKMEIDSVEMGWPLPSINFYLFRWFMKWVTQGEYYVSST